MRRGLAVLLLLTPDAAAAHQPAAPPAHHAPVRAVPTPASPVIRRATVTTTARTGPARASRSSQRPPLVGGPVLAPTHRPAAAPADKPRNIIPGNIPAHRFDPFLDAPHTHAGLRAWLATLGWPWQGIGTCESLHDDSWRPASTSWARGVFQFLPSTWRSLGLTGDPAAASWRDQLHAARRLRARDGLRAWDCARILGYT
jgi:hypothetical protein